MVRVVMSVVITVIVRVVLVIMGIRLFLEFLGIDCFDDEEIGVGVFNFTDESLFEGHAGGEVGTGLCEVHHLAGSGTEVMWVLPGVDEDIYLGVIASNALHEIGLRGDADGDGKGFFGGVCGADKCSSRGGQNDGKAGDEGEAGIHICNFVARKDEVKWDVGQREAVCILYCPERRQWRERQP